MPRVELQLANRAGCGRHARASAHSAPTPHPSWQHDLSEILAAVTDIVRLHS